MIVWVTNFINGRAKAPDVFLSIRPDNLGKILIYKAYGTVTIYGLTLIYG